VAAEITQSVDAGPCTTGEVEMLSQAFSTARLDGCWEFIVNTDAQVGFGRIVAVYRTTQALIYLISDSLSESVLLFYL
jgi:hypothetical protein